MPETKLILDDIRFPPKLAESIKIIAWDILKNPKSLRNEIETARELLKWCWWQRELDVYFFKETMEDFKISQVIRKQKFKEYDDGCNNPYWVKTLG